LIRDSRYTIGVEENRLNPNRRRKKMRTRKQIESYLRRSHPEMLSIFAQLPGSKFLYVSDKDFKDFDNDKERFLDKFNLLGTPPVNVGKYVYQVNGEGDKVETSTVIAFCLDNDGENSTYILSV
jgi:hypothetical protein